MPKLTELYSHQADAIKDMHNGCILCGGVGSGKSRTALAYFFTEVCKGLLEADTQDAMKPKRPRELYVITTAHKRDTFEWEEEMSVFGISWNDMECWSGIKGHVDSWNNIGKYSKVKNAFFIFDEQRVVGSGSWAKSFISIAQSNSWILLSATPGDTWMDYASVFVANGFYRNRTDFIRQHVVYSRFSKYPKVERYVKVEQLIRYRNATLVKMNYFKPTEVHTKEVSVKYDRDTSLNTQKLRWNPYTNEPLKDAGSLCYILRQIANSDPSRLDAIERLYNEHPRLIVFYNFNYELEMLRTLAERLNVQVSEWNGHRHDPVPQGKAWIYLVQYTAGAEGWNCIETDTIVFYSLNYSYKIMTQAAGRIDRMNTPYKDLYLYRLRSQAPIDRAVSAALKAKKDFNELDFVRM